MVGIVTILPTEDLSWYVRRAFEDDQALLDTYHLVNGTLDECVSSTMDEIFKIVMASPFAIERCAIYEGKTLIGFMVLAPSCLISFGIHHAYRKKEILLEWWSKTVVMLNHEFVTWLFTKNTRAINFLVRNGMVIEKEENGIASLLYLEPILETTSSND
jgi:hypothetical protein